MSHHGKQLARCDWRTPRSELQFVHKVLGPTIGLDPASAYDNPTGASVFYTESDNGLEQDWYAALLRVGVPTMFVNPPWKKSIMPVVWWMAPIWAFADEHPDVHIVVYGPGSVNSTWWHDYVAPAPRNLLPRGRVKYDPPPGFAGGHGPTFDTCITYWGPEPERFDAAYRDRGKLIV